MRTSDSRAQMQFTTLAHLLDVDLLFEAYRRIRHRGAPGVDGVKAEEYAQHLENNLRALHERLYTGRYVAPPVKRAWIPKEDGKQRLIGITTFEDKIVQRAVVMLLEAIYEQDFYDLSYGFRPGRSPHQAVKELRENCLKNHGWWTRTYRDFSRVWTTHIVYDIVAERVGAFTSSIIRPNHF